MIEKWFVALALIAAFKIIIHVYNCLTQFRLDNAITHIAASDIVNAPVVIVI